MGLTWERVKSGTHMQNKGLRKVMLAILTIKSRFIADGDGWDPFCLIDMTLRSPVQAMRAISREILSGKGIGEVSSIITSTSREECHDIDERSPTFLASQRTD